MDEKKEEIVVKAFEDLIDHEPSFSLVREWIRYAEKKGWNSSEEEFTNKMYDAVDLMRKYYVDRRWLNDWRYLTEEFDPYGYELCLEAEEKGLGEVCLEELMVRQYELQELINLVDSGWKPFEIEWMLTGSKPKGYYELYWADWDVGGFGEALEDFIDEFVEKYYKEYSEEYLAERKDEERALHFFRCDVEDILDELVRLDFKTFKKMGEMVVKIGEGYFEDWFLVYCREEDWEEIKKNLEDYVRRKLEEKLYEDEEDASPSPTR